MQLSTFYTEYDSIVKIQDGKSPLIPRQDHVFSAMN